MSVSMAKPDVHVFIDLPVEMALERLIQSRQHIERYETLENLKRFAINIFSDRPIKIRRTNCRIGWISKSRTAFKADLGFT